VDLICESPRNLLTLLFGCALAALVSRGLPSERVAGTDPASVPGLRPVRFAFTRADLVVGAGCCLLVAVLLVVLGVGVGMKSAAEGPLRQPTLGLDNASFVK